MSTGKRPRDRADGDRPSRPAPPTIFFGSPTEQWGELSPNYVHATPFFFRGRLFWSITHALCYAMYRYDGANDATIDIAEIVAAAPTPFIAAQIAEGRSAAPADHPYLAWAESQRGPDVQPDPQWNKNKPIATRAAVRAKVRDTLRFRDVLISTNGNRLTEHAAPDLGPDAALRIDPDYSVALMEIRRDARRNYAQK